jgi:outer membrane protein insertion porin family
MTHKLCLLLGAIFVTFVGQAWADTALSAQSEPLIAEVKVAGNNRVEEEAIRVHLTSRAGEPLNRQAVDKDIRMIYEMGFFSDVEAQVNDENGRTILVYQVRERPLIREVRIEGNKGVSKDDFETALKIHPRTILNPVKIRRGIEDVKKAYEKKGFLDAEITYRTEASASGDAIVTFTVNENEKVGVKDVVFEGNKAFSTDQLRSVMATRKKNFLSRFMGSGVLNNDALKTDVERLTAFYYDHGYINVRIDEPRVERREDGLYLTMRIDEGEQYQVGDIGFGGEVPGGEERAKLLVTLQKGQTFKASTLRDDVFRLTGYFSDQGYAFVNVEPETDVHPEDQIINITYQVDKGPET